MVHFNTSNLTSNTTSKYELEEFNGVDYTTTPTKVDDTRAINISNYLPEGNSLVKRYGYEKILGNYNKKADKNGIAWNTAPLLISNTIRPKEVYIFGDYLIVYNSGIYKYDKNNTDFDTTHTNGIIKIADYPKAQNDWAIRKPRCVYLEENNKLWLICDLGLYVFDAGNEDAGFVQMIGTSGTIVAGKENDIYIPTIALNYQPENSTGNSISYQQLNILNPRFKIELYYQTEATENGFVKWNKKRYDIGSLINTTNFTIESIEASTGNQAIPSDVTADVRCALEAELVDEGARGYNQTDFTVTKVANTNYVDVEIVGYATGNVIIAGDPRPDYKLKGYPFVKLTLTCKINDTSYTNKCKDLLTAKVGTVFGVRNSADRFFVGNTSNAPHTDWHTLDDENGNPNFTYFGTDTYNAIGSSQSEIVGYSYLNDGSLAIIKDNKDKTNIFVRTGTINTTTESYIINDTSGNKITYNYVKSVEVYPTISTGLLVKSINADTKFTLYDNKLIFNAEDGVYYLNLNATTSNQSYAIKELSYYIRDDLSNDLTNSSICTDNKYLYVARKNKNGQLRVYVANKDKYSFINGEAQYNWWVLDGIPAFYMFDFKNELWFLDDYYELYKMVENSFSDVGYIDLSNVYIGDYINLNTYPLSGNDMIFNTSGEEFVNALNIARYNATINKDNLKEKYEFFKNNFKIAFNYEYVVNMEAQLFNYDNLSTCRGIVDSGNYNNIEIKIDTNNTNYEKLTNYINELYGKRILLRGYSYTIMSKEEERNHPHYSASRQSGYETQDGTTYYKFIFYLKDKIQGLDSNNPEFNPLNVVTNSTLSNIPYLVLLNEKAEIADLFATYHNNKYNLDNCNYFIGSGWFDIETGNFIAETLNFNTARLTINGLDFFIQRGNNETAPYSYSKLCYNIPVQSYWYGKFTDLGAIDTLKTTKSIHFIPETRRGGFTEVGYRTRKTRQFTTDTNDIFTLNQFKVEILKNRNFQTNDLGINLNDINFNNFSFESDAFARTYSSKKKIKNFSFIQLKFESTKEEDSTITSLAIKYIYTKNNKGVK